MKLNFHLPNQNPITLRDSECLLALLEREAVCFAYGLLNDDKEWTRVISEELLNRSGRSLAEFQDIPHPNPNVLTNMDNRLIREALDFDLNKSKKEHQQLHPLLNPEQRLIYEQVIESVNTQRGQFYFVYGPGGTGKTFLYKIIISRLRSERNIVLVVASSRIASLLLPGYNGLSKTGKRDKIFKGMTVLLGDDFRQILQVIPKRKRQEIVAATYPNFTERQHDDDYFKERAILTPRNDDADAINAYMFDKLAGASITYNSVDEVFKASIETIDQQQFRVGLHTKLRNKAAQNRDIQMHDGKDSSGLLTKAVKATNYQVLGMPLLPYSYQAGVVLIAEL
ncbi:ATP-dependent DNA helicase PIF1-like protein [Tanacetum coccineum]